MSIVRTIKLIFCDHITRLDYSRKARSRRYDASERDSPACIYLIDRIEKDLAILLEISQLSKKGTPKNRRCHYPFSCLSTHPRRRRCACTRPASRRRGPFPELSLQLFNLSQLSLRLYCLSKTRMALFDRFAGIRGFG